MLCYFAPDLKQFAGLDTTKDPYLVNLIDGLFHFWHQYGVFVVLGGDLPELLSRLPAHSAMRAKHIYKQMIKESPNRSVYVQQQFDGVLQLVLAKRELRHDLSSLTLLAVSSGTFSALAPMGALRSFFSGARDHVEVCVLDHIFLSKTRIAIDQTRTATIEKELHPDLVWSTRLHPLVRWFSSIEVVDPFALVNFLECANPFDSGMGGMIARCAALPTAGRANVSIITSLKQVKGRNAAASAEKKLLDFLRKTNGANIAIKIADNSTASAVMHDRYILAGQSVTVDVQHGLQVLSQIKRKDTRFSWGSTHKVTRERHEKLLARLGQHAVRL